jgi:hypothetical protein
VASANLKPMVLRQFTTEGLIIAYITSTVAILWAPRKGWCKVVLVSLGLRTARISPRFYYISLEKLEVLSALTRSVPRERDI